LSAATRALPRLEYEEHKYDINGGQSVSNRQEVPTALGQHLDDMLRACRGLLRDPKRLDRFFFARWPLSFKLTCVIRLADMKVSVSSASLTEVCQLNVPEMSSVKSSPEIFDTSCGERVVNTFAFDTEGVTFSDADRKSLTDVVLRSVQIIVRYSLT
jgi:hypothetical protein